MTYSKINISDDIFLSVLENRASDTDKIDFDKWVNSDPGNKKVFCQMKKLWSLNKDSFSFSEIDLDKDWKLIRHKHIAKSKKIRLNTLMSYAALISLVLAFSVYYLFNNASESDDIIRYATADFTHIITLSDGSKVSLNKNSEIIYPKDFTGSYRNVELSGEAFFEVSKNIDMPFIIKSGHAVVEVLGTSFNIKNYSENKVVVNVRSGKVGLKSSDNNKYIFLSKGKRGVLLNKKLKHLGNLEPNYNSWNTGILKFKNTPLEIVLRDIEAYYGVKIINKTTRIKHIGFTSSFDHCTIYQVIEELELMLKIKVIKNGSNIILSDSNI